MSTENIIHEILSLYAEHGSNNYIGEPVSQLEHMSQAAQLAINEGYDDEVVLAAFFHDIGHLCVSKNSENDLAGFGIKNHEHVGALYLQQFGFSDRLIRLVGAHVEAKRYLCYKYSDYYDKLSNASKKTLRLQGGVMNSLEAAEFEQNPLSTLMIKMREWDDLAKEAGQPIIDMRSIRKKIKTVLST